MSRRVVSRVRLASRWRAGAACGGDRDGAASGATTVAPVPGPETTPGGAGVAPDSTTVDGSPGATGTPAPTTGAAPGSAGSPGTVAGGAPSPTAAGTGSGSGTFAPPEAGAYQLHTTGSGQVLPLQLTPQPIDEESTRTVDHLNDTDVRQSEAAGQSTTLRYLPDQVQLLNLDLVFPGVLEYHFVADPPVLFARVPPVAGQSWQWELSDTSDRITVTQATTVRGVERIEVAGGAIDAFVLDTAITFSGELHGSLLLTSWLDPARRTSVRSHQVTDLTYQAFRVLSDTTTDLVSFVPA